MKRRSANRWVWCCGGTLALCGCAQIAGLTGDYQVGVSGGAGGAAATGNVTASGGEAGASAGPSGGDAGAGGDVNANGGSAAAGNGNGGTSGGAVSGGSAGMSGGSAGMSGGGGSAGVAGTGGAVSTAGGPVFIASSQFHDSASGGDNASAHLLDATFDKPAGTAEGDFLLAFFGVDHRLTHVSTQDLAMQGWTLLDQQADYGTDGQGTYLMYRFASASEPAQYVFTGINQNYFGVQGLLSVYRGVNKLQPVNDYATLVFGTGAEVAHVDTPTPVVNTTVAHCLVITGLSPDSNIDAPVVKSWPLGFDENHVSVTNPAHPYPDGWANIYSAERHVATAGKVEPATFGWDIEVPPPSQKYFGALTFTLALAPAP